MLILVTAMVGFAAAGSAAFDRHASTEELLHEKRGRIIDAVTGEGISGAKVIGLWHSSGFGWSGSSSGCILEKIATTDAKGNYAIPDVSKELDISRRRDPPRSSISSADSSYLDFGWTLVIYKPGYIRQSDAETFKKTPLPPVGPNPVLTNAQGAHYKIAPPPLIDFSWRWRLPQVRDVGPVVQVEPILIVQQRLDPKEQIVYYSRLTSATHCDDLHPDLAGVREIRLDIERRVRNLPCNLPASERIAGEIVGDFTYLIHDTAVYRHLLDAGEPRTAPPFLDIEAGTVCRAVSNQEPNP